MTGFLTPDYEPALSVSFVVKSDGTTNFVLPLPDGRFSSFLAAVIVAVIFEAVSLVLHALAYTDALVFCRDFITNCEIAFLSPALISL
jgi:hypothetical protein